MPPMHVEWHSGRESNPTFQNEQHQPVCWLMQIHRVESQKVDTAKQLPHGSIGFQRRNPDVRVVGR
ncbi:hypothetical protein D3C81_1394830 [compost metagenome]